MTSLSASEPQPAGMGPIILSTRGLRPRDQRAAWHAWHSPTYALADEEETREEGFEADMALWTLGPAALSRVRVPRLRAVRDAGHIRRDPIDHWAISFGSRPTQVSVRGEPRLILAGRPIVTSLADPVVSEREADERLNLFLPRDRFPALAPVLTRLRGLGIEGEGGRMLVDFLLLVERSLPGLTLAERRGLPQAIAAMVLACAASGTAPAEAASAQIEVTRMEQLRVAVRRRIGSATLTTASLCREVGISRSQLYRMLEGEGGVMRFVQRMRLRAIHAALSDPAERRKVAALGEAFGFHDPSSFSRAFRREFGLAPQEVRAAALSGARLEADFAGPQLAAEARSLREVLRAL